ncbi:MAG: dihydroxyacetone kinase phosphoryl donor subunit DhaM [Lachnospiraceae bacterium]|nr:dihydroxyacetone kinase phosphoryl donor subunit DhaM [Lachnospiraceae bacterium]
MVGIVIVSHSKKLAESILEMTKVMAPNASVCAAGGLDDGSFGTSYEKIKNAIETVYSPDGVVILMDLGSAVMTTEMVLEEYESDKVVMADAPVVEGAIIATVYAEQEKSLAEILVELQNVRSTPKFTCD